MFINLVFGISDFNIFVCVCCHFWKKVSPDLVVRFLGNFAIMYTMVNLQFTTGFADVFICFVFIDLCTYSMF